MASATDLLKCSLCCWEFKDPRALPCLHTFCLQCLIELKYSEWHDALKCPMCKEDHNIPRDGAGGFRKDFRINSFMEIDGKKKCSVKMLPNQAVGMPVDLPGRRVPPVEAKKMASWIQRGEDVRSIACHSYGGAGVTILSFTHIGVYKQNKGFIFHSHKHDEGDRVTTFRRRCHAVLDLSFHYVKLFYRWPIFLDKADYTIPVRGEAGYGLSGTNNYLVHSAWKRRCISYIVCLSVTKGPKFLWEREFEPLFLIRSLSALESPKELLVVIAADCCFGRKKATALTAVNGPSKPLWNITFETLDREAERFDLRDMCNDGRYFYVLNTEGGCVYTISTGGDVLSKILRNLEIPKCLACSSDRNNLVVACDGGAVKVYKLRYKEK